MNQSEFLAKVTERIDLELSAQAPQGLERSQILLEAGKHLASAPGAKRARPRLVYSFGKIVEAHSDMKALESIAVAGEFIHGASLLHDDVVDSGTMRRGRPTANAKWNNSVAVLGGDIMLCVSIQALAGLPRLITNEAVELVAIMSRAAVLEVETRGVIDLTLDQWRVIAEGKTGSLFGWCGRSPAHLVGDQDAADRFARCGELLGIAFQLADDLKDLADKDSGKNQFSDILNRNPSFPVLWATQKSDGLYNEIKDLWAQETITPQQALEVGQKVLDTGAADYARNAILEHVGHAFDTLGAYRERPGGQEVVDWAYNLSKDYLAQTAG